MSPNPLSSSVSGFSGQRRSEYIPTMVSWVLRTAGESEFAMGVFPYFHG